VFRSLEFLENKLHFYIQT